MRSLGRIVYACLDLAEDRAERHMKYRVIQDRLFMSDFDKYLLELEKILRRHQNDHPPIHLRTGTRDFQLVLWRR